jgi:hypothetical protein
LGGIGSELLSGLKTKKITAQVKTVLIGKDIGGVIIAVSQASGVDMPSEQGIDPNHNFLEYASPFTIMAIPLPTIFLFW